MSATTGLPPYDDANIFARILRGEIPCQRVMETEHALAFRDIAPQAPVHVLVIPKGAYVSLADFTAKASDAEIAGFWRAVGQVARDLGLEERGYRALTNMGPEGGQEVPHFHVHLFGGAADRAHGARGGMSAVEARAALDAAGTLPDDELDLAAVALQFARVDTPDADWRAAEAAISALVRDVVAEGDPGTSERRRALLAAVIHGGHGYRGDHERYDAPENANLIRVVERRRGLPVALGLIWLHAASAAGWGARGLDFPGHFLLSLDGARGTAVVDPFNGGVALPAQELRALLKRVEGAGAELRPGLLVPMSRRAVLLRLQTNIRLRRLRDGDIRGALDCTTDMLRLAPDAAPLWREAALMEARLGRLPAALEAMDRFLAIVPKGEAADRARDLMEEWRGRLN